MIVDLCIKRAQLEKVEDVAGFLGVTIECDDKKGIIKMAQTGLVDYIICKDTLTIYVTLPKDANGKFNEDFNYASVLVILLYLSHLSRYKFFGKSMRTVRVWALLIS